MNVVGGIGLALRILLYSIGGGLALTGLATTDPITGDITLHVKQVEEVLAGVITVIVTFITSRFAEVR